MTWHLTDYTISSCSCRHLGSKWNEPLESMKCLNSPTAKAEGLALSIQGLPILTVANTWRKTLSLKERLHNLTVKEVEWSLNALRFLMGSFMQKHYGTKEGHRRSICIVTHPPRGATSHNRRGVTSKSDLPRLWSQIPRLTPFRLLLQDRENNVCLIGYACMHAQSHPTLWDPMDYSPQAPLFMEFSR